MVTHYSRPPLHELRLIGQPVLRLSSAERLFKLRNLHLLPGDRLQQRQHLFRGHERIPTAMSAARMLFSPLCVEAASEAAAGAA